MAVGFTVLIAIHKRIAHVRIFSSVIQNNDSKSTYRTRSLLTPSYF